MNTAPAVGTACTCMPARQNAAVLPHGVGADTNDLPTPAHHACAGRGSTGSCSYSSWPTVPSWQARSAAAQRQTWPPPPPRSRALLAPIRVVVIVVARDCAGPAEPRRPGVGAHGRVPPAGNVMPRGEAGEARGSALWPEARASAESAAVVTGPPGNLAVLRLGATVGMRPPHRQFTWPPGRWFFTVAFSLEALSKMVAMGLYCESLTTYFRSGWHWLDVLTVRLLRRSTRVHWLRC